MQGSNSLSLIVARAEKLGKETFSRLAEEDQTVDYQT